MIQFTDYEKCRRCGGRCCKAEGCLYAPEDFEKLTFDSLVELYLSDKIMFYPVLIDGSIEGWIVRTPQVDCSKIPRDMPFEKGRCVFLGDDGCRLNYHNRPRGGKLLIPSENEEGELECEPLYSIEDAFKDWRRYQFLIENVIFYVLSLEREEESFDHFQCEICGGKCCKNTGCYFSPKDFRDMTFEKMKRILSKGFISIVWVHKESTGLPENVLALKVRNKKAKVYDLETCKSNGGCILLESTGCSLEDEDRPYGGKALVPEKLFGRSCSMGYSMRQCADDWMPYQDLLKRLLEEFKDADIQFDGIC